MAISLKNFFNQKKAEQTTQLYADFNRLRNRQIELEKQRLARSYGRHKRSR